MEQAEIREDSRNAQAFNDPLGVKKKVEDVLFTRIPKKRKEEEREEGT